MDLKSIPKHVGVILDGNRRWSIQRGVSLKEAYQKGIERVEELIQSAERLGIETVTLYIFSTENWKRQKQEIDLFFALAEYYLREEVERLVSQGVRLSWVGLKNRLPKRVCELLENAQIQSAKGNRIQLVLAIDYGGRSELMKAAESIAKEALLTGHIPEVDEAYFEAHLDSGKLPKMDLIIRTSGEMRLSNFFPWQSVYAEFYFTPVFWPDFDEKCFLEAIHAYSQRQRRDGK